MYISFEHHFVGMKKKFYPDFQVVRIINIVTIVSSLKMNNCLKGNILIFA